MLHVLSPNILILRLIGQSASGGLSIEMEFPGSEEPKKDAIKFCEPAKAAAE